MTEPVFGITFTRDDNEARPVLPSDLSCIAIVGTSDDADDDAFPGETCVRMSSNDPILLAALGTDGTLPDAVRGINEQLADFQVAAQLVIVRVAKEDTEAEQLATLLGSEAGRTGIYALLNAGADLGIIPRLIIVPGYTHQYHYRGIVSIPVTSGGTGYTAPTVSLSGGGSDGAGFTGTLTVVSGAITAVVITNPGHDYLSGVTAVIGNAGGGSGAVLGTPVRGNIANPITAALPGLCSKLLAHAIVEGPGNSDTRILAWRETLASERLIPIDMWVKVQEGTDIVTRPGAPRVVGIGARRDYEKRGVPGHSWANQPVRGILGFARAVDFSLTDGATQGQTLLAANIGIGVRGEMGVENAISSSGFVFVGTDNAGDDPLWQFYSVTRMRDYIHLGLLRAWRHYLGKYNITDQSIQAVINTAQYWLRDLQADNHVLGFDVGFDVDKNSPENLRLGRFRLFFAAEEPPPLRRIDADSRRYRPALDQLLQDIMAGLQTIQV